MDIYEHPNVVFPPPRPEREARERFLMRVLLWLAAILLAIGMGCGLAVLLR